MNKKISTLLAGVALASAFSVNAEVGTPVKSVALGNSGKLYQLHVAKTTDDVLGLTTDGTVVMGSAATTNLGASLWCVNVTGENQGKNPIFDFTNKAIGAILDVNIEGYKTWGKDANGNFTSPVPAQVGGSVSGWKFSPTLTLQKECYLASYVDANNVAVLAQKNGKVVVTIAPATDAGIANVEGLLKFTLVEAAHRDLTASEFNTKLNTLDQATAIKLTFEKDYNNTKLLNPFSTNELLAEASTSAGYLNLKKKVGDKYTYLRVDTAYANTVGEKFLTFAFGEAVTSDIAKQYNFKMTYCPTNDSLYIRVEEARMKADDDKGYWKNVTPEINAVSDNNWVKLQDLVKADESRIVTIGKTPINTHISLGIGGCTAVKTTKTSLKDGVYYIKKGNQYLASPIYKNGPAMWVTVNDKEQDVAHMPAYQWVILKQAENDKNNVSPVYAQNREYPDAQTVYLSLNKKEGATYYWSTTASTNVSVTDSLSFLPVEKEAVENQYLGYKRISPDSLRVTKYTFNYWHPYATDKYIAKSSKDSTLTVLEGKSIFVVDTLPTYADNGVDEVFGYDVTAAVKKRISNLAQLRRTVYSVTLGESAWKVNMENKFNVGKASKQSDTYVNQVFFKENNHFNGKHYYAIVEATSTGTPDEYIIDTDASIKAGVNDQDMAATMKAQTLVETRTSAFAIEPDVTPLYRRFDCAELEGNAGDASDTLRFYEKYRKEYLQIESNPNFMTGSINFLGIYTADKSTALSFIVDTAWVNRGLGYIKPQYLISIDRNDFVGHPGTPCTENDNHYNFDADGNAYKTDKEHCVHAKPGIPGFERGRYLINFEGYSKDEAYMWKKYQRAGFVEAIRVQDTLYILRDEFKNLANDKIDFAAIKKANDAAIAKGGLNYIYRLDGDDHKFVTWSMRFTNRNEATAIDEAKRSFLIESMNKDGKEIAPTHAAWLKMQNGCLVLSTPDSNFDEVSTGADDALIFNVEHVAGDKVATDNEKATVSEVSVIAGEGQVTIAGAAGKKVVISNILGQTIANTVIASDNASIAAPAGVVVVAVEGEAAVKAIVK